MSDGQYDIDSDDNLFSFDPYDMLSSRLSARRAQTPLEFKDQVDAAGTSMESMSTPDHARYAIGDLDKQMDRGTASSDKGKQRVSMPMPIRPPTSIHDLFDVSPPGTSGIIMVPMSSSFAPSDFSSFTSSSSFTFSSPGSSRGSYQPFSPPSFSEVLSSMGPMDGTSPSSLTSEGSGKGKGRELPPTLPPLALGPSQLDDEDVWMHFDPTYIPGSSSSFGSADSYSSGNEVRPEVSSPISVASTSPPTSPAVVENPLRSTVEEGPTLSRTRSLSSLSMNSTTSSTTISVRPKATRSPSTFARKLIFGRKGDESKTRPATPRSSSTPSAEVAVPAVQAAPGNAPTRQWYTNPKSVEASAIISRPPPPVPILALETSIIPDRRAILKHKGRSHSSPLPFSALDAVVPATSTDVFTPLPLIIKNYFDGVLPRELRLRVLQSLIHLHEEAHEKMVKSERWSVNRASATRNQWVGKDRGVRELFKLSRVSKSWRSLVYDGQLWTDFDLHSFPRIPRVILQRIAESAGPFIQSLNLAGLTHLDSEKLLDVTSNLCLMTPSESLSYTQLTSIHLQGCSGLTTRSLHHLLIRSRSLKSLNLRGLSVVTNTTCEILATYCPELALLNLNRCPNMDADGVHYMASASLARQEHLRLKELRVCGLKHTSDEMMGDLGKAAPYLEVLDLSYARRLHNSALEAFIACDSERDSRVPGGVVDTVVVCARDLGRDVNDSSQVYFRRRVTRLRHLNLSFCILLTDTACANLAYSVPRLEYLEMAGIGAELKEAGLVRMFERTPFIRRVDLEDSMDVGDAVLAALTPAIPAEPSANASGRQQDEGPPQAGHTLEVLNLSSCINVNDHSLLSLVRGCPKLTVLEADGTRISSTTFREFVRLSKERQLNNAKLVAVDCRGINENLVKELQSSTRPRMGWRAYGSRRLFYLDGRDGHDEDMKVAGGQDECDEKRVVVKTFYSWQTVDAVKASRERRKAKAAKEAASAASGSSSRRRLGAEGFDDAGGRVRWWSPGRGRGSNSSSGRTSPLGFAEVNDGCRAM